MVFPMASNTPSAALSPAIIAALRDPFNNTSPAKKIQSFSLVSVGEISFCKLSKFGKALVIS